VEPDLAHLARRKHLAFGRDNPHPDAGQENAGRAARVVFPVVRVPGHERAGLGQAVCSSGQSLADAQLRDAQPCPMAVCGMRARMASIVSLVSGAAPVMVNLTLDRSAFAAAGCLHSRMIMGGTT
jgi:hypothetical protein